MLDTAASALTSLSSILNHANSPALILLGVIFGAVSLVLHGLATYSKAKAKAPEQPSVRLPPPELK